MDHSEYIKVVSYNTQCLSYGQAKEKIIEVLKELDADVVGIQEVDLNTRRSGPDNQMHELAKALGYDYWFFGKTISHQGGAYGHGILSKYPIRKSEIVRYTDKVEGCEDRTYERHVLSVDGLKLTVYNTHITGGYGRLFEPLSEVNQVAKRMALDPAAVLTGDFNLFPDKVVMGLPREGFTPLNTPENPLGTTTDTGYPIDNIILSGALEYKVNEETKGGITVHPDTGSDHYPIVAYIKFKEGYDFKY